MLAKRFKELQAVPVRIADFTPVYMDLRKPAAHDWWKGSPWAESPQEQVEQRAMRIMVRPGDVVYDIGANMGLHAVLLYRLVGPNGRLVSLEPNAELHLRRTIKAMPGAQLFQKSNATWQH